GRRRGGRGDGPGERLRRARRQAGDRADGGRVRVVRDAVVVGDGHVGGRHGAGVGDDVGVSHLHSGLDGTRARRLGDGERRRRQDGDRGLGTRILVGGRLVGRGDHGRVDQGAGIVAGGGAGDVHDEAGPRRRGRLVEDQALAARTAGDAEGAS